MSDERGRRRKRRIFIQKDREEESELSQQMQQMKPMVILSKHSERASSSGPSGVGSQSPGSETSHSPSRHAEGKLPVYSLLKSRDSTSRAASPSCTGREGDTSNAQPVYQIQKSSSHTSTESNIEQRLAVGPEMPAPVKLVDDSFQWCDNALEFLLDQTDFYVVGVLGLQGSGKSTIMSALSGQHVQNGERQLFRPQSRELKELGVHCTSGIDIYVTPERMILLDTQPVLSASVLDYMIQYEKKAPGGGDYHSVENSLMMQSLQMASFLIAVCHTVIVVQDWFADPNLLRFLLSAEMLKPTTPSNPHDLGMVPEEAMEYFPHVVFVQNKCTPKDFSPENVKLIKDTLGAIFAKSKLKCKGDVNQGGFIKKDKTEINLFLLPKKTQDREETSVDSLPGFKDGAQFDQLSSTLSFQILAMPKPLLTHTALSEKNWFHYSARLWEAVKKSTLFLEYSRLLP